MYRVIIIIIIDNRGLNARWCLTPLLLSLPTAAYLGQRGLTPAGLPHTAAQCHLSGPRSKLWAKEADINKIPVAKLKLSWLTELLFWRYVELSDNSWPQSFQPIVKPTKQLSHRKPRNSLAAAQ